MPPDFLVTHTFLGQNCGAGVNPSFRDRLVLVEQNLKDQFDALPDKTNPSTGNEFTSHIEWIDLHEPLVCWRQNAGHHSAGSAADINVTTNPYIVTRTGNVLGGEAAGQNLQTMRQQAVAVYDRAMEFFKSTGTQADVSARRTGESTSDVYDRFLLASSAIIFYLTFAFKGAGDKDALKIVTRQPVEDIENASADDLGIPSTELRPKDEAIAGLEVFMASDDFQNSHPNWPNDTEAQYLRILRDYELVRIPMVLGNPSPRPQRTRNPARGFLDLHKELVVALVEVGELRWGACDFGPQQSGDIQHFDRVDDDGFPQG